MIEMPIKFVNFAGREVVEKYFFHLSLLEMVEIELRGGVGIEERYRAALKAKDGAGVLDLLRELMQMSVGQQSEDGRKFIKSQDIRDDFEQTGAYSALFVQLATGEVDSAKFFAGVMPSDLHDKAELMKKRLAEIEKNGGTAAIQSNIAENEKIATSTKPIDAYTLEELLDLPDEEYLALSKRHEHNKPKALILAGRYRNK